MSAGHPRSAHRALAQDGGSDRIDPLPLFDGHPRMQTIGSIIESIADTDTF